MGRRRTGPRQLKPDGPYCAVLHVPLIHREKAGKVRLVRSLQTHDHNEALRRYSKAIQQLEQELDNLLGRSNLRTRVEQHREGEVSPGDAALTPMELTNITLGSFNPDDPTHVSVYESFESGQPLPISWSEALDIHVKVANRNKARSFSDNSLYKYRQAVNFFSPYAEPTQTTPQIIRQFLSDHEENYDPVTVAQRFRFLRAIYKSCIAEGLITTHSPFDLVIYKATAPVERERRAYTDHEIRLIHQHLPEVFSLLMTGLRAGEYFTREPSDLKDGILRVDEKKDINWRPKYPSSVRNVAVPPKFVLDPKGKRFQVGIRDLGALLRQKITTDPTAPLHSSRHTFLTLSRRAGCDTAVITAQTGHHTKDTSRVAQAYGVFPDEVLIRETKKVWEYVYSNVLKGS